MFMRTYLLCSFVSSQQVRHEAAAALATRDGRTDVDQLALLKAFAGNGSGDVVAGPHCSSEVLRWQVLSEAGDADDPARR